jgi:predicted RNase H-like HicB family nuclease
VRWAAATEEGYWAVCQEIPGANTQGETAAEAEESLRQAIERILADRTADSLRGLPRDVIQNTIVVSAT